MPPLAASVALYATFTCPLASDVVVMDGAAVITDVGAEVADADPAEFVAVTTERNVEPTSATVTV